MLVGSLVVLAACGGGKQSCGPAPAALPGSPELPPGFPTPPEVTYTAERQAGPSRVVEGVIEDDLGSSFEAWRAAFERADGYDVVKEEQEAADAEVNFAGGGTTGQVRLVDRCAEYLNLTVVIRPDVPES